jgi:very-short-patch-repair endonuclease
MCKFKPNSKKICDDHNCATCIKKSFLSSEKAIYWNYELNDLTPKQVYKTSNKLFWFTCENCFHDFDVPLKSISKNSWCPYCANKRICDINDACETCLSKTLASLDCADCWIYELNKISDPYYVFKNSRQICHFKCNVCSHTFSKEAQKIYKSSFCSFCSNRKLCPKEENCQICKPKSFAVSPKAEFWNYKLNVLYPIEVFRGTDQHFWFTCDVCNHDFKVSLDHLSEECKNPTWCPYCVSKKICPKEKNCEICISKSFLTSPRIEFWDYTKNTNHPAELFKSSGEKCWFICENNHNFQIKLHNISQHKWCSLCINKTEAKVLKFMKSIDDDVIYQYRVDWCKNKSFLPFDFCFEKYKLIIELDGRHHFSQVSNWVDYKETHKIDEYKWECAKKNGYSILRLFQKEIWENKINWKSMILEIIEECKSISEPRMIVWSDCDEFLKIWE